MTVGAVLAPPPAIEPWRIEPVWEARDDVRWPATPGGPLPEARGGQLPEPLAARYGADLVIPLRSDRPTVVADFVSTIDGIASYDPAGPGGGRAVSGDFEPDRFLMGLLRATADAVLVGAGTVRTSRTRGWTPERLHPGSTDAFADWRRRLGLAPQPTAVLLTGSGVLAPDGPWQPRGDQPLVVMTTERGAARLRADGVPGVEALPAGPDGRIAMADVLGRLAALGHRLVSCEAGPTVFGQLVAAGMVDELFLTVSPRLGGRDGSTPRPGLVDGVAFEATAAPPARLRSVMRAGDHLFLRYRVEPGHGGS